MYITEKSKMIIKLLLDSTEPTSMVKMADKLSMSTRSIRNYMKEVGTVLEKMDCELVNKTGVGVFLLASEEKRLAVKSQLPLDDSISSNPTLRQNYIIGTLLKNRFSYTIQLLADDLFVGKGTIIKDLEEVEKWFFKHHLTIQKKPNFGIAIEGSERDIRNALTDYNEHIIIPDDTPSNGLDLSDLDYRIDEASYRKLNLAYPRIDIRLISDLLNQTEMMLGCTYTVEAFIWLVSQISLVIERAKHGKKFFVDAQEDEYLQGRIEYKAALWIVRQISQKMVVPVPDVEAFYLTIQMMGAGTQIDREESELSYQALDEIYKIMTDEIIDLVGSILQVSLKDDQMLKIGLALHLKRTFTRYQYSMQLHNPLLNEIKQDYSSIFGACWATSSIFERYAQIILTEDEVAFIAIHIGAAISRQRHKIRTIVVCASGIGTSQLIARRIEGNFPEILVINVLPSTHFSIKIAQEADLIITTVPIRLKLENMLMISPQVNEQDVRLIRNMISQMQGHGKTEQIEHPLQGVLHPDLMLLDSNLTNKQQILEEGCQILFQKGYVKQEFLEDVLNRERITSTTVGKGVAIPHGVHGFVHKPGILMIKLRKPISWDDEWVDLIFILALKFTDLVETKEFFRSFYKVLNDEKVLRSIRQTADPERIINILVGESQK